MLQLTHGAKLFLKVLLVICFTLILVVFFIPRLLGYIAPFIVALFITFIIEKPVQFLEKRAKFPRGAAVALALLGFVVVSGGLVVLAFYKIVNELWRLAMELPKMQVQPIIDYFDSLVAQGEDLYLRLPGDLAETLRTSLNLSDNLVTVFNTVSEWLKQLTAYMIDIAKSLPQIFIFIIVSIVATYFMSRDRNKISNFLYRQLPKSWGDKLYSIKNDLFDALIGFVIAQSILISVTFLELLVGYWIIGVKYALFFALLTATVDALPVLGTGTILIPTAAIYLILGNTPRAFAFIVLYAVILAVRQFLEPKVMGESLGLHPLVTLMSIYIGLQLFGVAGLVLGPVIVIIIKALQKARILPQWKS